MITTNNIKYLGVTITKQVEDFYNKIFKDLREENKEVLRRFGKTLMDQYENKNGHPTKSNLHIQCNSHHNSNTIIYRP